MDMFLVLTVAVLANFISSVALVTVGILIVNNLTSKQQEKAEKLMREESAAINQLLNEIKKGDNTSSGPMGNA